MQAQSRELQGSTESSMPNVPQQIGHYKVGARIGAGGMGEVYRARDMRLNRDVALKVLPQAFAEDPDRMARFEREAQLLASLNHPKIAAIYGLEESGATRALVMELVQGPTLAERIATSLAWAGSIAGSASPVKAAGAGSGAKASEPGVGARSGSAGGARKAAIPLDEALALAQQVAEALEYAHEHGVVHRDLKPANIKITFEGEVKVLDFGLARAMGREEGPGEIANSPTLSLAMTEAGIILGTAAYMAPEQARGKQVDRRADIWAFGCVLYEMLTGQKAFEGETVSDVLASVIRSEPDWRALPPDTPPGVQRLIRRCLQKDVRQRLQAIGDARIAIEEMLAGEAAELVSEVAKGEATHGRRPLLRPALPWVLAVAGVATAAALFLQRRPSQPGVPLRKFEINAGNLAASFYVQPQISPDGRAIAYVSDKDLYFRKLDELVPRKLYSLSKLNPIFWSADSQSIGFEDQGKLWQIPVSGGAQREICALPGNIISGAWGAEDTIYFSAWRGDMYKVAAAGGDAKPLGLQDPKTEVDFHDLSFLPGGKELMYVVHLVDGHSRIEVLAGEKRETVYGEGGWDAWGARYSAIGHLILQREEGNTESIWAVPFSLSELKTTGQPFMVSGNGMLPSVSADGTLLYVTPAPPGESHLVWVDRSGRIESSIGEPQKGTSDPALSPDGKRVALVAEDSSDKQNLFVYDLASGVMTPLLGTASGNDKRTVSIGGPVWTPDGHNILFTKELDVTGQKIMQISSDGSGRPRALLTGILGQLSSLGKLLAYVLANENGTTQACYATFSGADVQNAGAKPICLPSASGADYGNPRVSPDGHYVAFVSNSAGSSNVYVAHFPDGSGRWQVSPNGGTSPLWSHRGDELFYVAGDELMSVKVATEPSLSLGAPVRLFSLAKARLLTATSIPSSVPGFGVSADGKSFLMVQQMGEEPQPGIVVDQNWFAEFSSNTGNR
jgi:eukaryotic-like serine/threonine-protein kinase